MFELLACKAPEASDPDQFTVLSYSDHEVPSEAGFHVRPAEPHLVSRRESELPLLQAEPFQPQLLELIGVRRVQALHQQGHGSAPMLCGDVSFG